MPWAWWSSKSKDEKKKANKESIIDAFKRKLGWFASQDRSSGCRSRRRRYELIVSSDESGAISPILPSSSSTQSFAKKTNDMSTDLPADLIEEILSRVPATSLKRLRSVCKRWNSLFKEPGLFSDKHFRNAPKQSRVLMLKDYSLFPMSVNLNVVPPSIEFKYELDLLTSLHCESSEHVYPVEVFHCDGLLLCVGEDNKSVVVWNPYIGETRWIQHKNGYDTRCRFALGYENNNNQSCHGRSYKTLMYWDNTCLEPNPVGGFFEIYEFGSNSWRVVIPDDSNYVVRIGGLRYRGVTLKGNTYWICVDDDNGDNYLLCFDFTRERFRRLCLPPSSSSYMALSVVSEERLSMLSINDGYKLEMWVTSKKFDDTSTGAEELSWSKYSFGVLDLYRTNTQAYSAYTSLFLDEEKRVALCCNSLSPNTRTQVYTIGEEDIEIPRLNEPFRFWLESQMPFLINYVPSLVHIQTKIDVQVVAMARKLSSNFWGKFTPGTQI